MFETVSTNAKPWWFIFYCLFMKQLLDGLLQSPRLVKQSHHAVRYVIREYLEYGQKYYNHGLGRGSVTRDALRLM